MPSLILPILTLLVAMLSIQVGASVAKQLFPLVGAAGATSLRLLLASLILMVIWKPWKERLALSELRAIVYYGASLGCMNLLFYQAIARIPLGIAVAVEFTGPLSIALLASRRVLDFIWALLAAAGILMILPLRHSVETIDPIGVLYALGAGLSWALYIIFGKRITPEIHAGKVTTLGMLVGTFLVLPVGIYHSGLKLMNTEILRLAFGVAILSSALPYSLEMISLRKLPAKTFSILMSLEPVFAAFFGLLFLGESLSWIQWAAIGCVMMASVGSSYSSKRSRMASSTGER